MAGRVEGIWRDLHRLSHSILRSGERRRRCSSTHASGGMRSTELSSLAIFLLLLHSAQASDDDLIHEASGSTHLFGSFHMTDRNPASLVQSDSTGSSKGSREQPEFSSKKQKPPELLSKVVAHDNETHQWPSNVSLERVEPFTLPSSVLVSNHSSNSEFEWISELEAPAATSRAADPLHKASDSSRYSPEQRNTAASNRSSATAVNTQRERPDITTTIVSQPTIFNSNTVTTTSIPFTKTTNQISTTQSSASKRHSKTPRTAIRTTTTESPKTTPRILPAFTSQSARLDPSRSTLVPSRAAATEASMLRCNITDKMWIKTVLTVQLRRSRLDSILKQNLPRGFTQALKKALNDSTAQAKIERISSVPNVTVGYYVTRGAMVYTASVVLEALSMYGIERLMADIRQFVPLVQAIPIPAVPWRPSPAISLMLKTGWLTAEVVLVYHSDLHRISLREHILPNPPSIRGECLAGECPGWYCLIKRVDYRREGGSMSGMPDLVEGETRRLVKGLRRDAWKVGAIW